MHLAVEKRGDSADGVFMFHIRGIAADIAIYMGRPEFIFGRRMS
jgi:hypothetical protein